MTSPTSSRWFHLTPGRFILALLAVEVFLWLSERFGWLGWHKGYAVLTGVAVVGVGMLIMLSWYAAALIFRWPFHLSNRTRMVRFVFVVLPFCWLALEMKKAGDQSEAVIVIVKLGGDVHSDFVVDANGNAEALAAPPRPEWLLRLLGIDFFAEVRRANIVSNEYTGRALQMLKRLSELNELCIAGHQVTDATLEDLTGMHHLRTLVLTDTAVTDTGVAKLQKALPNCKITR